MRLGDLDALKEYIQDNFNNEAYFTVKFIEAIDNAPTVDTFTFDDMKKGINVGYKAGRLTEKWERPQGKWIPEENTFTDLNGIIETYTRFKCSVCNQGQNFGTYPYCSWCGSKMKEEIE